ncbi:MAG TPA: hypothetical protein VD835_13405 [Pyrinomonadaceae bacterium]|nr:hypothetical protein [Pyrinomonadaceae bacterium]
MKSKTAKSGGRKPPIKLSTRANVSLLIALLSDTTQGTARERLEEWTDELTAEFGLGVWMGNGAADVQA